MTATSVQTSVRSAGRRRKRNDLTVFLALLPGGAVGGATEHLEQHAFRMFLDQLSSLLQLCSAWTNPSLR